MTNILQGDSYLDIAVMERWLERIMEAIDQKFYVPDDDHIDDELEIDGAKVNRIDSPAGISSVMGVPSYATDRHRIR